MSVTASSVLEIDLDAVSQNLSILKSQITNGADIAGVVKANAYGLGVIPVAKQLQHDGVSLFFVATLDEGIELRAHTNKQIAILNGLFSGAEGEYQKHNLIPVISSLDDIARLPVNHPHFMQLNTGMNRLGIHANDFDRALSMVPQSPSLVLSHLSCADEIGHEMNDAQLNAFKLCVSAHPNLKYSLANSSAIFLGDDYHFNVVRPGMAIYGLNPTLHTANPMRNVVSLKTRILQIDTAKMGESSGYSASHIFTRDSKIATVSLGYADGFLRSGSSKTRLYWQNQPLNILGRVSMDLIVVDLTDIPPHIPLPNIGDFVEVIGNNQTADDLATQMNTIGYEVLTSLSKRSQRIYKS